MNEDTRWYCAHAIFYYKYQDQESFLVHENVYLINAADAGRALQQAERIAKENQDINEDGHLELNGSKAQYLFVGIRKIIEVELNPETDKGVLHSGMEATYSVMELDSMAEVESLSRGDATMVLYRE